MEIRILQPGDDNWKTAADYAEACSWRAGPFLAKQMRGGDFSDWERVFAAFDGERMAGYCTLSKTDCIPDVAYTPFISFVFVGEPDRGSRLSQRLIEAALQYAKTIGFSRVYLVSGERGLYEKYGFQKREDRKDFWGNEEQIFVIRDF